jgi:hypothetical protein
MSIVRDIGAVAARMFLNEAHMAHWHLGTTLAEVVRQNASKQQSVCRLDLLISRMASDLTVCDNQ